jgi:glycosyltransferase involved in cell wall biosynthesis
MRISYFNYHYDIEGMTQGAANQIRAIAAGLTRLGHQVDLRFRRAKPPGENRGYLGFKKIGWARRYGHLPRLLLRNFSQMREEKRLLDAFQPDVLLAVSSYAIFSALLAARSRRLPFVLFCDGPVEYEYSLFFHQVYYSYPAVARGVEGWNVRAAQQVITISEILKGFLMRYNVPASKIHVVPNGVDPLAFRVQPADQELQERLGLQGRLVVGYIGNFEFFGNVPQFVAMASDLCRSFPHLAFLFVGEGTATPQLRGEAAQAGLQDRFIFTGTLPHAQVPAYLSLMDIVISPYRDDYLFYGSSMKLLEYMAGGKAVLFPALGQIKEVLADGYNGMLYEPGDQETMGQKLQELISNPELRARLGVNARQTIDRNWTWDRQAAKIAKVLQQAREEYRPGQ